MKLQFKTKIKEGQILPDMAMRRIIERPDLTPAHVVSGGPFNDIQFKMAMRKLERAGAQRPPKRFALDDLPSNVTVDDSGFLAVVTIDMEPQP